jgi:hypothetical protein
MSTDISEEHMASIFRVEYAKQDTSIKAGSVAHTIVILSPISKNARVTSW